MSEAAPQEPTEVVAMPRKRKDVIITEPARTPMVMDETTALVAMIERAAKDPTVDIDRMRQLMAIHAEATARRAKVAFLADFSALQSELPAVAKGGKGHNDKRYARFEDVIGTIRPFLVKHGFSLSFRTQHEDKVIRIIGVLGHRAGHEERTDLPLPADTSGSKNAVQAWGSTISYGKRYVALTLLGIATTDDDDDGQRAGGLTTLSEAQVETLFALIAESGANMAQFLIAAKVPPLTDDTGIDAIKDRLSAIRSTDFDRLKGLLERKKGAAR